MNIRRLDEELISPKYHDDLHARVHARRNYLVTFALRERSLSGTNNTSHFSLFVCLGILRLLYGFYLPAGFFSDFTLTTHARRAYILLSSPPRNAGRHYKRFRPRVYRILSVYARSRSRSNLFFYYCREKIVSIGFQTQVTFISSKLLTSLSSNNIKY